MKELVQIDSARFDPTDPIEISRVLERVLVDDAFRDRLVDYSNVTAKSFTWDRAADLTAEVYQAVGAVPAQATVNRPARRRQIAFCTPFPPEESGVADYTKRFLETLVTRHPVRVDVVGEQDPSAYTLPADDAIALTPLGQFDWLAKNHHYDSIVYCMGNSSFHEHVYERLKQYPGIVWLHDIRLTGFYRTYYSARGCDSGVLPPELAQWGSRYPNGATGILERDPLTMHHQGIYFCGEVAHYASRLVVGSQFSKEVVTVEGAVAPITVLPLAAMPAPGAGPASGETFLAKYGLDADVPLVVSIGIVAETKCARSLVAACASLDRDLTLAFVGWCNPTYRSELERVASEGASNRLRLIFTGYVAEQELDGWLTAATCAAQPRFPTNGESSGALMRALPAGVPTIINDHGSYRELPADAVFKIGSRAQPADLAAAITAILSDEDLRQRLSEGARRYADEVSFEKIVDRFWQEVILAS